MPDQNPIYDFMKSNKLTDLDEKTFINKYSAPDKAKEIYTFMAENKLTDLDESKFYDKYLKKKLVAQNHPLQNYHRKDLAQSKLTYSKQERNLLSHLAKLAGQLLYQPILRLIKKLTKEN